MYILLFKPFLPAGHLGSQILPNEDPAQRCLDASFAIHNLARAYREVFQLRHAPFLFIYALFCAATVVPMDFDAEPSCVDVHAFFWDTFQSLQSYQPVGLRKPIAVIRTMFERAGINPDAFQAVRDGSSTTVVAELRLSESRVESRSGTVRPQPHPEQLVEESFDVDGALLDLGSENYESLFGLFGWE